MLEDPWKEPDPKMFQRTSDPREAPNEPRVIEIEYEQGRRGRDRRPAHGRRSTLLAKLNQIAGEHGVGRVDLVENRFVGMKSRGVYETPGGSVLHAARAAVESITLDREVLRLRQDLMPRYAALVYNGFWFAPEREALQRLVDDIAQAITGTARLRLYKGAITVLGRKAPQQPVPARYRHVRGGLGLRPARRAGLHQAQRAADADPQRARNRE